MLGFRRIPRTEVLLMTAIVVGWSMTCICQASSSSSSRNPKTDHVVRQQPIPLRLSKDDTNVLPPPRGGRPPLLILQVEQALQQEQPQEEEEEEELLQLLHLESLFSPRRRSRRSLKQRTLLTQQQQHESLHDGIVSGMTQIKAEEGTLDLLAVCNGFQPTEEDDFLRRSVCTCQQGGSIVQAFCEQNHICVQSEPDGTTTPRRIYGDYSYQASRDFKSPTALALMAPNHVLSELLAGDYTTCFDYYRSFPDTTPSVVAETNDSSSNNNNSNSIYAGRTVCWMDDELFGDHPTCHIEVNGEWCTSCDICDNKSGPTPLIRYDCTNIFGLEQEQVNECGPDGEGLHDTLLQFLDSNTMHCPTSSAAAGTTASSLTWTRSALSIVVQPMMMMMTVPLLFSL
jgi:hypothetical protein